jgi:hypothetical protein
MLWSYRRMPDSLALQCKVKAREKLKLLMETETGEGFNVGLPFVLWHSTQLGRQSCQLHAPAALYPWHSFLLEAEQTPGLLNADRRNRSLEKFPRILPGIEPGTSRLVAHCLNQLSHRPHFLFLCKLIVMVLSWLWCCLDVLLLLPCTCAVFVIDCKTC